LGGGAWGKKGFTPKGGVEGSKFPLVKETRFGGTIFGDLFGGFFKFLVGPILGTRKKGEKG